MERRVCVIGGGASGLAAAWMLSNETNKEKFVVELWEKESYVGGVATTENVSKYNLSAEINDGVQGGAVSYRNCLLFHEALGFQPKDVFMKVCFGELAKNSNWNNTIPTTLVKELKSEIRRFGFILKIIHIFELLFIFIPIHKVLKWFWFSDKFASLMVYPLTALFFGTGNQTANVSAAIVARVFLDSELRLFDYDESYLLSQTPKMFAFPPLRDVYQTAKTRIESSAERNKVYVNRPVKSVIRNFVNGKIKVVAEDGAEDIFDHVIFACNADVALRLLSQPTTLERAVLGNVRYFEDITITHLDREYIERHYSYDQETLKRKDQYFVRSYEHDPTLIEMSFDLTHYQSQLTGENGETNQPHIFQTIFLDKSQQQHWTIDKIDQEKILLRKWWHQFSHSWRHFAFTVPYISSLQGQDNIFFAGSYTLVNTHEIAVISGLAAAHQLGAVYPFAHDRLAKAQFESYLAVAQNSTVRWLLGNNNLYLKDIIALFHRSIVFLIDRLL